MAANLMTLIVHSSDERGISGPRIVDLALAAVVADKEESRLDASSF
jgi:hypothetical protein